MREYERFCGVHVVTYCIMSNYFHILVEVPERPKEPLSDEALLARLDGLSGMSSVGAIRQQLGWFRARGQAEEAGAQADVSATFARWKSPWFYLPDEKSYGNLLEAQGFRTISCRIELEEKQYDTDQAVAVFASGAAQGYTGKEFYDVPIDDDYVRRFNNHVRLVMENRARDGKVTVDFRRLYYIGIKS
jgi:hypothetical protein